MMWFRKQPVVDKPQPIAAVVPIQVEKPEDWTAADAKGLSAFLTCPLGQKLCAHLYHDLYTRLLATGEKTPYKQGLDHGRNSMLGRILSLAEAQSYTDDDETDDTETRR